MDERTGFWTGVNFELRTVDIMNMNSHKLVFMEFRACAVLNSNTLNLLFVHPLPLPAGDPEDYVLGAATDVVQGES